MRVHAGQVVAGAVIALVVAVVPGVPGAVAGPGHSHTSPSASATKSPQAAKNKAHHRKHAKRKRALTLKVSESRPAVGSEITFSGRVPTTIPTVLESRIKGGEWSTVTALSPTEKGRFSTDVTVADATARSYRVRVDLTRVAKNKTKNTTAAQKKAWRSKKASITSKAAKNRAHPNRSAKNRAHKGRGFKNRAHKHRRHLGTSRIVRVVPQA